MNVPLTHAERVANPREPDVRPGTMIAGKYRIDAELGRGGFGVVVRATHVGLSQPVAIKILTAGDSSDVDWEKDAARFCLEARATAALKSEHVVRILDADVLPGGIPYIVMEYLEGYTLHSLVYGRRGPLAVEEAVDFAIQVLAALAEAHSVGIVHRDLKPANVFLTRGVDGKPVVKVLDFGVSKIANFDQGLTHTGAVVGTVAYMAPEQIHDAKRVDGRADLWSVGMLLYEGLSRRTPFGPVDAPGIVSAILTQLPMPLLAVRPDLPSGLEGVVMRCLEKDAARRFSNAAEVAMALAPFASPRALPALHVIGHLPAPSLPGASMPDSGPKPSSHPQSGRARGVRGGGDRTRRVVLLSVGVIVSGIVLGAVLGGVVLLRRRAVPAPAPTAPQASADPAEGRAPKSSFGGHPTLPALPAPSASAPRSR